MSSAHPAPAPPPVLELQGIAKTYRLGPQHTIAALSEATLTLAPAEMLALTGPSGSGKSTLLHVAGLIDQADAGRLLLLGQDVTRLDAAEATRLRREHIGFIFQSFHLVPVMSVAENVEFPLLLANLPRAERQKRVAAVLDAVGLQAHARQRPDLLSGGQRQRVAIARALVKQPKLVIADEPTANLDSTTAEQVLELMREAGRAQGASFLIASHDARLVERCDRVVTLRDGRITEVHTTAAWARAERSAQGVPA